MAKVTNEDGDERILRCLEDNVEVLVERVVVLLAKAIRAWYVFVFVFIVAAIESTCLKVCGKMWRIIT